ncbi:MAG: SCO family protein [Anaerolinea sp.]|nr:SCO family protein [Anaerolinea sp.]
MRCISLLVIVVALVSGCASSPRGVTSRTAISTPTVEALRDVPTPDVYLGDVVDPPVRVQDFTLPSSTGEPMSFSDLNGQWRVLFIGYMHCPDFCPTTLAEYRRVKALLSDAAEQVTFVYLSVDGARDTPEMLRTYLDNFDPAFVGFAGDDETLARIQPDYGFYYRRNLTTGSQMLYTIDHSTRSYLIDPDGLLRTTFTYQTEPQTMARAIAWYVQHET